MTNTIDLGFLFKVACFQNDSDMFTIIRVVVIQIILDYVDYLFI